MNRVAALLPLLPCLALADGAHAQVQEPSLVPSGLKASAEAALAAERSTLINEQRRVLGRIQDLNGKCSAVRSDDSAQVHFCEQYRDSVQSDLDAYNVALAAYEAHLRATPPESVNARSYRPAGNALVGGTGWTVGYYSPVGASPEVRAKALQMLREQARRAQASYDEAVDLSRYNFVIGIAASTDIMRDLRSRVIFDQLHNGQYSAGANYQSAYNSLKGRSFDSLGCHSNGAMVCLAALENGDIAARDVTLYGPQVTTESLSLWNQLVVAGKIKSLKILINQNDPVPPASLLFSPTRITPDTAVLSAPLFFSVSGTARAIETLAPSAKVLTFRCGRLPDRACHSMSVYTAHDVQPARTKSVRIVPGTAVKGKGA